MWGFRLETKIRAEKRFDFSKRKTPLHHDTAKTHLNFSLKKLFFTNTTGNVSIKQRMYMKL